MPFHFPLAAVGKWLLTQAGSAIFGFMKQRISEQMGLSSRTPTTTETKMLLDDYFHRFEERLAQRIIDRLDEDRLVRLNSAITQLKTATRMKAPTVLKQGHLLDASSRFFDIANLPEPGNTGGFSNAQLRCLAFLGIAAVYMEMNEALEEDIAKNIVAAVYADPSTAQLWFGEQIVARLLRICPKCGTENSSNARFCKNDGQPLAVGTALSLTQTRLQGSPSQAAIASYCSKGHKNPLYSTVCNKCGETISASYCSIGHANPLGTVFCTRCREVLAFLP